MLGLVHMYSQVHKYLGSDTIVVTLPLYNTTMDLEWSSWDVIDV